MIRRTIPLLLFLYAINAQIALPTFQGVHKPHSTSSSSLYDFTSQTFTNCGETGKDGPTLSDCTGDVNYSDSWTDNTDYFNVPNDAGIQYWTVPVTGTYTIEAYGAEGGDYGSSYPAGEGARMRGDFDLSANEIIRIVVGQRGDSFSSGSTQGGGGGGGTFVIRTPYNDVSSILIIAGGGGGSHRYNATSPKDGSAGTSAVSNSNAGTGYSGGGGGGFLNDGADGDHSSTGGKSFLNGSVGGNKATSGGNHWCKEDGGFGGGSGGSWAPGSGGGYIGSRATSGGSYTPGGSGGGSYNSGSNQSNSAGARADHGQVIITIN